MHKWLSKDRFLTGIGVCVSAVCARKRGTLFSTFPMLVPRLPWSKEVQNGAKTRRFLTWVELEQVALPLSHHLRKGCAFWLSLCLSRACLGKMIVFTYKRLKRPFSPHMRPETSALGSRQAAMLRRNTAAAAAAARRRFEAAAVLLILSFPYVLSWACLGKMIIVMC